MSSIGRNARRVGITLFGSLLVLVGIVLIPLPGPGILLIIAGLAVLGREYEWARRVLEETKRRLRLRRGEPEEQDRDPEK